MLLVVLGLHPQSCFQILKLCIIMQRLFSRDFSRTTVLVILFYTALGPQKTTRNSILLAIIKIKLSVWCSFENQWTSL